MGKNLLLGNALSIVCVVGAVVAMCFGVKEGWGWLLLIAAFCAVVPKGSDE